MGALGLGAPVARRLGLGRDGPGLTAAHALALGCAFLVTGGQLLGILDLFRPGLLRLLLGLALAAGAWPAWRWWRTEGRSGARRLREELGPLRFALLPVLIVPLALAIPPAVFYDALLYHYGSPSHWLLEGSTLPEPGVVYTGFPMPLETLFAESLALGGRGAPPFLQALIGLATIGASGLVAARRFGARSGLGAAVLVGTLPMTVWLVQLAKPELLGAYFGLLAASLLLEGGRHPGRLLAFGLYLGLAACAKPTNALYLAAPLGLWLLAVRGAPGRLARVAWPALGVALAASPWMLRELAYRLVHGSGSGFAGLSAAAREALSGDVQRVALSDLPSAPWSALRDLVSGGAGTGTGAAWQWLVLLPLALWAAGRRRELRPLLTCAAVALLLRAGTYHTARFGYAVLPLLVVVAAGSLPLDGAARRVGRVLWGLALAAAVACWSLTLLQADALFGLRQAFAGPGGSRAYLTRHAPSVTAFEWIDANTEPEARVLLVGETRRFHLRRRHVVADVFHPNPLHRALVESSSAEDVARRLREAGFTHLLIRSSEQERLLRRFRPVQLGPREGELLQRFLSEEVERLRSEGRTHVLELRDGTGAAD